MPDFPDPKTRNVLEEGCERCPSLVESRNCISWGNGAEDARVIVVGEAPGKGNPDAERWRGGNWTGLAYTSRHSGQKVRDLMSDAGVEDVYYTNAVKCFPEEEDGDSNREPARGELENCWTHLKNELDEIDPEVVVTTGKHSTNLVLEKEGKELDGFVDSVLEAVDCDSLGVSVVPVLHPSYQDIWLSRLGYSYDEYVEELRRILLN
ncbi:uracil-DNA glycosylase family protein [Halorutilales archaeon Cl-col2-1]